MIKQGAENSGHAPLLSCSLRAPSWLYRSPGVAICKGGVPASDPRWRLDQVHDSPPCVSFPLRPVLVEKEGMTAFVGGPNRASFFNHNQSFCLKRLGPHATESLRFHYSPELIAQAFGDRDGWTHDAARPFPVGSAHIGNTTYLAHRIVQRILETNPDPLLIEEGSLTILAHTAAALDKPRECHRVSPSTRRAHQQAVRAAEACIATRFAERLSVSDLAREAHVAATHLCRIYRACTGITLHESLTRQRLRHAIKLLMTSKMGTSEIAHACGFSSRSHLSDTMKRTTGARPKDLRHASARTQRAFLSNTSTR